MCWRHCPEVRVERSVAAGGVQETILKRNLHPIRVQAEDRASRKFVTKVSGLEDFCIDPADFSSTLQRVFSTSAAVQRLPGKQETGMEIHIQGNVLKELVAMLRQDWGIPDKYIEVENKTK
jgi:translation initiation factor 2D